MTPAEPWAAVVEQARLDAMKDHAALAQWELAQRVEQSRQKCLAPNGGAEIMECVNLCGIMGLPLPSWLADAFKARYELVRSAQVGSWDAAFGPPWPPRTRLATVRANRILQDRVHAAVVAAVMANLDRPINRAMFAEVGRLPGIHRESATVERIYYQALKSGKPNATQLRTPRLLNTHLCGVGVSIDSQAPDGAVD